MLQLQLGQVLKGKLASYQLIRRLEGPIWLAMNQQLKENVVIKHSGNFHTGIERDALRRFQERTQHIRPLLDEIDLDTGSKDNESKWPALVLKWLDDDVLSTCIDRQLSRAELKRVGHGVLKALEVLHGDRFVHTDIKPNNVLVNYNLSSKEITDVQLADLESTVHEDSKYAKDGAPIGTPIFRSTEAMLRMPWGTPTDIWSFGTMMISLIYGSNFHIFEPDVPCENSEYEAKILMRQAKVFGPFPFSYLEIADSDRLAILSRAMEDTMHSKKPFRNTTNQEVSEEDKRFLLKVMKLDPRDRPTVRELLADEWFESL